MVEFSLSSDITHGEGASQLVTTLRFTAANKVVPVSASSMEVILQAECTWGTSLERQAGIEISPSRKELAQMTTPARNSSPESAPGQNIHHAGIVAGAAKRTGVFGPFESGDVTSVLA